MIANSYNDYSYKGNDTLIPLMPQIMEQLPTIGGEGKSVSVFDCGGAQPLETIDFNALFDDESDQ